MKHGALGFVFIVVALMLIVYASGHFPDIARNAHQEMTRSSFIPKILLLAAMAAITVPAILSANHTRKIFALVCMTCATLGLFAAMALKVSRNEQWLAALAGFAVGAALACFLFGNPFRGTKTGNGS